LHNAACSISPITSGVGRAIRISVSTLQKWVEAREKQNMPAQYQNDAQMSKIQKERTVA
jgi:hypothetical protein